MNVQERIAFFRKVSIFSASPDNILEAIAEKVSETNFEAGTVIFSKGDKGDSMFFITRGQVTVHDGDHVFTRLKEGDFFGKYFLIDQQERSATVTALTDCSLLGFAQEDFYHFTRIDSSILHGILKVLVTRLRDMNIAEEKLAELNATKDKFFSIIAHDLRSPISTLISLSEILRTETEYLTPEQKNEILNSLFDLSKNYLKLLDNLLQWSQIQTGRMKARPSLFNINQMIREVVAIYIPNASEKGITIIEMPGEYMDVWADRDMIRTVLRNLINNAVKFTAKNGVITISAERAGKEVLVDVKDTGTGMADTVLNRLFRLENAYSSRGTDNERGTGLGLILCKEFVEQNGGRINVVSEEGKGSTFSFTIPLPGDTP